MNSGRVIRWQKYFSSPKDLFAAIVMLGMLLVMLWYHPILTVVSLVVGVTSLGIINQTADDIERAQKLRDPVPADEVLSFSLEKEFDKNGNHIEE